MHQKTTEALARFRALIKSEELSAGGFLPSERDLCKRLQIGRSALRVICAQLESENLLARIPNKGLKMLSPFERHRHKRLLMILPNNSFDNDGNESMIVIHGAAVAAQEENAELVLFFTDMTRLDPQLKERLQETSWNGVILMEEIPEAIIAEIKTARLGYCIVNYEQDHRDIPAFCINFREVGRMAGRYFASHGYRRIGFIGGDKFLYREELAGLKGALAEEDLAPDPDIVFLLKNMAHNKQKTLFRKTLQKAIDGRPCAFFCGRDHWASLLFTCCRALGLRIPEDVAILGYDGLTWDEAAHNGLSSIIQPAFEIGGAAVHALCRAKSDIKLTLVPPGKLVERTSVGGGPTPPPAE